MLEGVVWAFPGRAAADSLDGTKDLSVALFKKEVSSASKDRFHSPFLLADYLRATPFLGSSFSQDVVFQGCGPIIYSAFQSSSIRVHEIKCS